MEENPENKIEKATAVQFNAETVKAVFRLLVPLAVSVLSTFGWDLDWDLWLNICISFIAVCLFLWTWWKNNNITEAAQEAQLLLNEIKQTEKEDPTATIGGTGYDS